MVLCNYLSNTDDTVTYAFGTTETDITGVITFDIKDGSYIIEKLPTKYEVYDRSIVRLFAKYREDFKKEFLRTRFLFKAIDDEYARSAPHTRSVD